MSKKEKRANQKKTTDLCIIGGGAAGLSVAAAVSQMGLNVVLIEHKKMGGDCLNYGCVPSKSLLAAAHHAKSMKNAPMFGIAAHGMPQVDYAAVCRHIDGVQAQIAINDSVERFTALGVEVIQQQQAHFVDKQTLVVGSRHIRAKYFVIATGSSPLIAAIEGLTDIPYLTNETIFDLEQKPEHLLIIGGGPIGAEIAQAHAQLGTTVSLLATGEILPKDDRDLVEVIRQEFIKDGINLIENIGTIQKIEKDNDQIVIHYQQHNRKQTIRGSHLLLATGRKANVENLNLAAAGVDYTAHGISVDQRLRTRNKRIFAVGDATGPFQFTHIASYQASIAVRNIVFKWPAKVDYRALAWVDYTDPELAHVGMSLAEAKQHDRHCRVIMLPFGDNDRAQAERQTKGLIKVIVSKRGTVLGCGIVGHQAGELLLPWCLAVQNKLSIRKMATLVAPYPTLSEISQRVATSYYAPLLFGNKVKCLVRLLNKYWS